MTSAKEHFKRLATSVLPRNYKLTLKPNLTEFTFTEEEVIDVEDGVKLVIPHVLYNPWHPYMKKKKRKNCEEEPWLTRYMYVFMTI